MLLSVVLDRPRGELRLDSHSSRLARLCCMVIMSIMGSNPTIYQDISSVDENLTQFFYPAWNQTSVRALPSTDQFARATVCSK